MFVVCLIQTGGLFGLFINKKNKGFFAKFYKSVVFSFILICGIFVIGLGFEYINLSGENNPQVIGDGILSILACGILILLLGVMILFLLINNSEFEVSCMSLIISSLLLIIVYFTWDTMNNFGSQWTQMELNFDVILVSFLLFWNTILFKSLFESRNNFTIES